MGIIGQTLSGQTKANKDAAKSATNYNNFLTNASQELWGRAQTIADRDYEAYTGDRVADLSENEQQAYNLAGTENKQGLEYAQKAGNLIGEVDDSDFSGETINKYMNPYVEGVVNQSIKKANLAAAEKTNELKGQAASRGAFGGARQSLLEGQAEKSRLETVGDITTSGYANAYQSAIDTWKADNSRKLSAAQAYQSVGNDITKMNSQQVQDLLATGGTARALEQLELDTDYNAFIEERDWDANNLQYLISALGASKGNSDASSYLQNTSSNAGQVIGAVSAIAGFFGKSSSGNSYGGTGAGGGTSSGGSTYNLSSMKA